MAQGKWVWGEEGMATWRLVDVGAHQGRVDAIETDEVGVVALFGRAPLVDNDDRVRVDDGGEAVCHEEDGVRPLPDELVERLLDLRLGLGVESLDGATTRDKINMRGRRESARAGLSEWGLG